MVGLGPGDASLLPPLARDALSRAQAVVGYGTYLDLVPPELLEGKTIVETPMRQERARAEAAVDHAQHGTATAVVSSGDAGIYGMAGLILETMERRGCHEQIPWEVIPGIPALAAAAARLGAPLTHDFAVISLSDLLTPEETIRRRLLAAAQGDFVTVLYNPCSTRRTTLLPEALRILAAHRPQTTPVGFVRNAYRHGETMWTSTIAHATAHGVDMRTIVLVGSSSSRMVGPRILTPRGYYPAASPREKIPVDSHDGAL